MEIQKNSRQIPSDKIYTANKSYSDILYGYLQHISLLEENLMYRYIPKADIKYTAIAADLSLSRQTVSKKFNNLVEQGLLSYDAEKKWYILNNLEAELATLLPEDTVRVLCNTLQERCLSILAYLLKTYVQHGKDECEVSLDVIKGYVGLNVANRGTNNDIVRDIFIVLQKLGLIEYRIENRRDAATGGYKTVYVLEKVDNCVQLLK